MSLTTAEHWREYLRRLGVGGCAGQLAHAAHARGFRSLEELTALSDADLLRIPSVGRGTLDSLRTAAADVKEREMDQPYIRKTVERDPSDQMIEQGAIFAMLNGMGNRPEVVAELWRVMYDHAEPETVEGGSQ